MATESYNGWANYETWLVFVYLTEDQGNYYFAQDLAEAHKTGGKADPEAALAEQLKEYISQDLQEMPSGLYRDLLTNSISRVDFVSIAADFLS